MLLRSLDVSSGGWGRVANLLTAGDGHRMAIVDGRVTVMGGAGHDYNYLDSMEQWQEGEGGAKKSKEEPGGGMSSQEEPEGARGRHEEERGGMRG